MALSSTGGREEEERKNAHNSVVCVRTREKGSVLRMHIFPLAPISSYSLTNKLLYIRTIWSIFFHSDVAKKITTHFLLYVIRQRYTLKDSDGVSKWMKLDEYQIIIATVEVFEFFTDTMAQTILLKTKKCVALCMLLMRCYVCVFYFFVCVLCITTLSCCRKGPNGRSIYGSKWSSTASRL